MELRYGSAQARSYQDWSLLARVGAPQGNVFAVQWLLEPDSPEATAMIAAARRELDFYLTELHGSDPWAYAMYHCNTASNMYSDVHWSFFPDGQQGAHASSKVVHLPGGGTGIVVEDSIKRTSRGGDRKE